MKNLIRTSIVLCSFLLVSFLHINHHSSVERFSHSKSLNQKIEALKNVISVIPEAEASGPQFAAFVRFWYFMIVGWPNSTTYNADNCGGGACDGPPQNGMLGMVNDFSEIIGKAINSSGTATDCAGIPTTGDISHTDTDGTFTIAFSAGDTLIPTGYPSAGTSHAKKVAVTMNNTPILEYEFTCDAKAGIFRFNMKDTGDTAPRIIEMYFDASTATDTMVDFYMRFDDDSERLASQFRTYIDNKFSYWVVRAGNDDSGGTVGGFRVATYGDYVTRQASAYVQFMGGIADMSTLAGTTAASNSDFKTTENGGSCSSTTCEVTVCVNQGSATLGAVCSGLNPAPSGSGGSGLFDSAPTSLLPGSATLTINFMADDLGSGLASVLTTL